jgi:hypothetical protein
MSSLEYLLDNGSKALGGIDFMKFLNDNLSADKFNLGDYILKGLGTGLDTIDKYSRPISLLGGIWGGYNQQNMAKKQFGLQSDAYNYNKMLSEENRKRRTDMDKAFNTGFGNV